MRLSDVLSKLPVLEYKQVEGFLGVKELIKGKQRKIQIGKIALNYYCKNCNDIRTFYSNDDLYCIRVNEHLISIDSVIFCHCEASVQIWFLVDCDSDISTYAPSVRIINRTEKLSNKVMLNKEEYGVYSELLEKSQRAYRDRLGAGSMVYLRKVYEQITVNVANVENIPIVNDKGKPKPFRLLLEEVDKKSSIIPREFAENGYQLFRELSDVVHGEYDEGLGLIKYEPLYKLIIGILDNVRKSEELRIAIKTLGWTNKSE